MAILGCEVLVWGPYSFPSIFIDWSGSILQNEVGFD